jgi:hypothetical protein
MPWWGWLRAWGPLLGVLAVAAALRLWDLGGGPDPFDVDEGYTGVDALRVLAGHPTLYFAANNGAEPLYVYLAALSTALLGPSAFALRLPAALAGVASVLATYLLVRAVFAGEEPNPPCPPFPAREGGRTPRTPHPPPPLPHRGKGEDAMGAGYTGSPPPLWGEGVGGGGLPGAAYTGSPLPSEGRGVGGVRFPAPGGVDASGLAVLAALLQAVSLWHVHLSRDASRVGLLPLLGAAAFFFFLL